MKVRLFLPFAFAVTPAHFSYVFCAWPIHITAPSEDVEANSENTPTPSQQPTKKVVSKTMVTKLTTIPPGLSLEDHLQELKDRPTAHESFSSAMQYPIDILEGRVGNLQLDGKDNTVLPFAKLPGCNRITGALKGFDSCYDEKYRSKSQLSKMPGIAEFLNDPDHTRMTPYSLEFRLCGKDNCRLCEKVGRSVRTPDVEVNGRNLREEVLRFNTLPVENENDDEHFLPPPDAREHIDTNNLTVEDLTKIIPTTGNNSEEKKLMAAARQKDKGKDFSSTKVRATAKCSCGALRAIFSTYKVGNKGGPSQSDFKKLERSLEVDGYTCGEKVKAGGRLFYSRRALKCGLPIEPGTRW